jgi:hypothetical protein
MSAATARRVTAPAAAMSTAALRERYARSNQDQGAGH